MPRWSAPPKPPEPPDKVSTVNGRRDENITDDPLAAIETGRARHQKIYSVCRVNPLFIDQPSSPTKKPHSPFPPSSKDKSTSSGYGDSFSEDHLVVVLEQNPNYVKSIRIASRSTSSGGTLTAIPEGEIDQTVPEPVWPDPNAETHLEDKSTSVKELLSELLHGISETLEGRGRTEPEEMLRIVDEQIRLKLQLLRGSAEEEVRRFCVSLSKCRKKNSVVKALSHSSSRASDCPEDVGRVYGGQLLGMVPKKLGSLKAVSDEKPSVWQQYYGVKAMGEGEARKIVRPADIPLFPGGRPETDFTLDVPRSDHLLKRMENDKKWRCRCRLLTSFLGLVFFLLSVMVVSLILTRGKRMFGSMV